MNQEEFRRSIARLCEASETHHAVWDGRGNKLVNAPLPEGKLPTRFAVYPIAPGRDTTRIGILDFDNHGQPPLPWEAVVSFAEPMMTHLRALGHNPMAFRSQGGSGIHIWLIWDTPQKAASVRELLFQVIEACGMEAGDGGLVKRQIEIFPKQDAVEADGFSSCIDPPLGNLSRFLNEEYQPVDDVPFLVTSEPLPDTVQKVPEEKSKKSSYEWDTEVIESALAAVSPDDYGDWITVIRALKGGSAKSNIPDEEAQKIALKWSRASEKHTDKEFLYKWERGCKKDAARKGRSIGSLYWLAESKYQWKRPAPPCVVSRIIIQDSDPKLYLVHIVGSEEKVIAMRFADLTSKTAFVNKVGEVIDRIIKAPKPSELNEILKHAEHVEADDDATILGQFRSRLILFLDEALHDDKEELRLEHRAWRDEDKEQTWFKWRDFEGWLRRQRRYDVSYVEALHYVRALGGGTGKVDLGEYGEQTAWWVPINPRESIKEPGPAELKEEYETPI